MYWLLAYFLALVKSKLTHSQTTNFTLLKELADDKINVTEKLKFVLGREENSVANGENAGYHYQTTKF